MLNIRSLISLAVIGCTLSAAAQEPAPWKPAAGPLVTRWTNRVTPENAHREYPRPQLVRRQWSNLNGLWDYTIRDKGATAPQQFAGKILVPFPIESALSGVATTVGKEKELWYRRPFRAERPAGIGEPRLLLHFGAVDWQTTVWVNGRQVGQHEGGYDPFSFDITDALKDGASQELLVRVWDPTDEGYQPRGKQVKEPRGIWYTPVTGIWQTVWTEWVAPVSVERLSLTPNADASHVKIEIKLRGDAAGSQFKAEIRDGDTVIASQAGDLGTEPLRMEIARPRLWSPDDPFLYGFTLQIRAAGSAPSDQVSSYFALRKIEIAKDEAGVPRMALNGKSLFQFGPLDQGWWPDGLYTAPSDAALRYDLEVTKKLGFNMVRKHVKVEPARWYYHCDQLGLLVWQDMPNGDAHIRGEDPDLKRSPESAANYRQEWQAIMDALMHFPCIVVWVPFNEGWGQFDTAEILQWTKNHDPTRLVDGPSGWTDRGVGDMHDMHRYPGPGMPAVESQRAVVLGEFGGLGLPLEDHLWWNKRNWGYRTYATREQLHVAYEALIRRLRPLIARGLAAAVYTQTTDVEGEVNGLMTYDRAEVKFDVDAMAALHRWLFEPQESIVLTPLVATSESQPHVWRYTTEPPAKDWMQPAFADDAWQAGEAGFGEPSTPGAVVRTKWTSEDIWMRRTFVVEQKNVTRLFLRAHHDEDAEIYLNGKLIASLSGYVTEYGELELGERALAALREGENVLAVHCHQTGGGQYIDIGLSFAE